MSREPFGSIRQTPQREDIHHDPSTACTQPHCPLIVMAASAASLGSQAIAQGGGMNATRAWPRGRGVGSRNAVKGHGLPATTDVVLHPPAMRRDRQSGCPSEEVTGLLGMKVTPRGLCNERRVPFLRRDKSQNKRRGLRPRTSTENRRVYVYSVSYMSSPPHATEVLRFHRIRREDFQRTSPSRTDNRRGPIPYKGRREPTPPPIRRHRGAQPATSGSAPKGFLFVTTGDNHSCRIAAEPRQAGAARSCASYTRRRGAPDKYRRARKLRSRGSSHLTATATCRASPFIPKTARRSSPSKAPGIPTRSRCWSPAAMVAGTRARAYPAVPTTVRTITAATCRTRWRA